MILRSAEAEKEAVITTAKLMCAAARTAPKGKGVDTLETLIVLEGPEKDKLAAEMDRIAEESGVDIFTRDRGNLERSEAVVLVGTTAKQMLGMNCGYCGFPTCESSKKAASTCAFNSVNLGIALGSAVSVASTHKIDNRIMYTLGRAAINCGLFSPEVKLAFGIPLYVGGKSPFFDR